MRAGLSARGHRGGRVYSLDDELPDGTCAAVAVGTGLAVGPPRRSQRALLAHWAPTLGTSVKSHTRPRMHDADRRYPASDEASHALPGEAGGLAPTPKRPIPVPCLFGAKVLHRFAVAGHRIVGAVRSHHARQPAPLLRYGPVAASLQLDFRLAQLRTHPLRTGATPEREAPAPRPATAGAFAADRYSTLLCARCQAAERATGSCRAR
jgi:hypothetical protein